MKKITSVFFALLVSTSIKIHPIVFPILGFETLSETPIEIDVEWNEKWFGDSPATIYNHGIARIAAMFSELSYVDVESNPKDNPLAKSYKLLGVKDDAIEYHYNVDYSSPILKNNQTAFSFASTEINSAEGKRNLVFVVIRGTPKNANEWTSNIAIGDSSNADEEVHEGFYYTMQQVHNSLIYYLLKHKIDPDNTYFLITGHSRGAAVSNLLGATLCDEHVFNTDNMYVYTFATPNVSSEEKTQEDIYGFIWNIVNAEDVVPTVPPNRGNWKFKKYGRTLTIVNRWNTDADLFENSYLPRMNKYFNMLLERDYCPFRTGPFVPSQITRIITSFYKTVDSYYGGIFGLRKKAENLFAKVFTSNKSTNSFDGLLEIVNRATNGGFEYAMDAFLDMHACEAYFSWMLALNEDEAYSTLGSTQVIIKGSYECAVFDEDNNMLLRIYDGMAQVKTRKAPLAVMPFPKYTVIGFPATANYRVVIYKDSIIPTIIPITVEQYDASGVVAEVTTKKKIYPHLGTVLSFTAGTSTYEDSQIECKKFIGRTSSKLIKDAQLKQQYKITLQPEVNINSDGNFGGGIHIGTRTFYASALIQQSAVHFGNAFEFDIGFGHQQTLYGTTLFDMEFFTKYVFSRNSVEDGQRYNIVPAVRLSLCSKPFRRTQYFVGGMFDAQINDFNDGAFDSSIRTKNFTGFKLNETVSIRPSILFGIKF